MVMYSGEGDEYLDESLKTTAKVKYVQQSVNSIAMKVYSMNNILREAYTKWNGLAHNLVELHN